MASATQDTHAQAAGSVSKAGNRSEMTRRPKGAQGGRHRVIVLQDLERVTGHRDEPEASTPAPRGEVAEIHCTPSVFARATASILGTVHPDERPG